jgi:hypothetical protein
VDIETMIEAARARRDATTREMERAAESSRQFDIQRFHAKIEDLFGADFLRMFGVFDFDCTEHGSPFVRFSYRDRVYSLRGGRYGMALTRMDPREDSDVRELPRIEFNAHSQEEHAVNRDNLFCALSDLSEQPDTPYRPRRIVETEPEPSAEERLIEALREIIRTHLES